MHMNFYQGATIFFPEPRYQIGFYSRLGGYAKMLCHAISKLHQSSSTMLPCTITLRHDFCIHSTSPSSSSEQDGQFVTGSVHRAYLEWEKEHPKQSDRQKKYRSRMVRIFPIPLPDDSPLTNEVYTFYIALQTSGSLIPPFPVVS